MSLLSNTVSLSEAHGLFVPTDCITHVAKSRPLGCRQAMPGTAVAGLLDNSMDGTAS